MAYLSYAQGGTDLQDYLYRDKIAGMPDANTMHTNIAMDGTDTVTGTATLHDINDAGTLDAQTLTNSDGSGFITIQGDAAVSGNLGTGGYSATDGYPAGWGTGVHTDTVYAEGVIGTGTGGASKAWMDSAGDMAAAGKATVGTLVTGTTAHVGTSLSVGTSETVGTNLTVGGSEGVGGSLVVGGNVNVGVALKFADGAYLTQSDTTWLRLYGANFYTPGTVRADGSLQTYGEVDSPIYYDISNHSYYVQPGGHSHLNSVAVDNSLSVGGTASVGNLSSGGAVSGDLQTIEVSYPGYGCIQGHTANNAQDGGQLWCKGGAFVKMGSGEVSSFVVGGGGNYDSVNRITGGFYCPGGTTTYFAGFILGYASLYMCSP
jgi:hypothetical protein